MYNDITRDNKYINELKQFILENYNIKATSITKAKRGYYGETWKLESDQNTYFLKLDYLPRHQEIFKNSLAVIDYFTSCGVDFIGKVIKTCDHQLYSTFNNAILGVFSWIDGYNHETDETKASEYQLLCQIYPLSKAGFNIPTVQFSDNSAKKFYENWENLKLSSNNTANQKVLELLELNKDKLDYCASRLLKVANICAKDTSHFYITHGDAGGNYFIGNDKIYILDWDEVMYAPLERDAWVMCCRDWARDLFNDTLQKNHIDYALNYHRLAFYCYHMYFHYLNEFLADHQFFDMSKRIEQYFKDGWINERIEFANTIEL